MISKDIASIIAKYNKPNVYKLHFDIQRYNIKKYIVGSSKDDVIKLIYDKRHDYNWLKWFYYYTTDYYYYGNLPSCSQHNFTIGCEKSCQRYKDFDNFDAWVKILNPNIKLIKFAFD